MNQPTKTSPEKPRVAVISAMWHAEIVGRARESFIDEMARHDWPPDRIDCFDVPGAYEIPFKAQQIARGGRHAAIVGIALVADGGIYRHDFVAAAVIDGMMRVQLDEGVPVYSAVLIPHHFHEHDEHRRFFGDHFVRKGTEVAQAALHYLQALPTV